MPDHHEDSRRALDGGDHRKPDIHRDVLLGADLDGADDLMGHVVACDQRRIHAGGDGRENNHIATSVAPADQGTVFRIGQDVSDAAGERRVFLPDRIGVSESLSAPHDGPVDADRCRVFAVEHDIDAVSGRGDTHRGDLTAVRVPVTVDGGNDHVIVPVAAELGFELAERPHGRVAAATGILIDATARIEMQRRG